jgi:hypothetical protein
VLLPEDDGETCRGGDCIIIYIPHVQIFGFKVTIRNTFYFFTSSQSINDHKECVMLCVTGNIDIHSEIIYFLPNAFPCPDSNSFCFTTQGCNVITYVPSIAMWCMQFVIYSFGYILKILSITIIIIIINYVYIMSELLSVKRNRVLHFTRLFLLIKVARPACSQLKSV